MPANFLVLWILAFYPGAYVRGAWGLVSPQRLHDSLQLTIIVSGEVWYGILEFNVPPSWVMKIVENRWAVGALPEPRWRSSQCCSIPPSWWRGGLLPPQEHHPHSQPSVSIFNPSVSAPINNPRHAPAFTTSHMTVFKVRQHLLNM